MLEDLSIQFLLFTYGPSHKLLGVNPVNGLKKNNINSEYYFIKNKFGKLIINPKYVFCLKPFYTQDFEIISQYKKNGSKIILILNDMNPPNEKKYLFDFVVSPSITWKKIWDLNKSNIPCFLINEEFDYFQHKIHYDEKIKLVTFGYSENLKKHLSFFKELNEKFDFTIISDKQIENFKNIKFKKFSPSYNFNFENDYDKKQIKQFEEFNVGFITQHLDSFNVGRTSNRLKMLLYAGLPVICQKTENHQNLWFNNENLKINYFLDDIEIINYLKDYKKRQEIVNYNYEIIRRNSGIVNSAYSFLNSIVEFEK